MPRKPTNKTGRKRGRLTPEAVMLVVAAVDAFDGIRRISWDDVRKIVKRATSNDFTRQGLEKNDEIRKAYDRAVERHHNPDGVPAPHRRSKPIDAQKQTLEAELTEARNDLANSDRQIVLITHNARLLGVSMHDLLRPMEPLPKGATDRKDRKGRAA